MKLPIDIKYQQMLGGIPHTVHIWGTKEDNPIIVFLHGGPGIPNRHRIGKCCQQLTGSFALAAWDQRGTGGSCQGCDPASLTPEQLARDCGKLIDHLCLRYYQTKVILVCSGFGIRAGQQVARKYPHKIALCVACGDADDVQQNTPGRLSLLLSGEYSMEEITGIHKGHALWLEQAAAWPHAEQDWPVPCYAIQALPETAEDSFFRQFKEITDKEINL